MGVWDQEGSILHKLPEGEASTAPVSLMSNSSLCHEASSLHDKHKDGIQRADRQGKTFAEGGDTHSLEPKEVSICFLWKWQWEQEVPLSHSMERMAYQVQRRNQSYRLTGSFAVAEWPRWAHEAFPKRLVHPQLRHSERDARYVLSKCLASSCFKELVPEGSLSSDSCRIAGRGTIWSHMSQTLVFPGNTKLIFSTKDFHWCQLHFWRLSRKICIFSI